jgi:hypothetical protein
MKNREIFRSAAKWTGVLAGIGGASYLTYASAAWLRYGHTRQYSGHEKDPLLDLFMPKYDVADRHRIYIAAPAEVALSAAKQLNWEDNLVVRTIFKAREMLLQSKPDAVVRPHDFLENVRSMGWRILAEMPGRELVMGAITKPWEANPTFTPLPPDEFADFQEPGYVKIVWTLRADSISNMESIFRTETRAIATDAEARKRFRRYWALLSPGIITIRVAILPKIKVEAERRWRWSQAA